MNKRHRFAFAALSAVAVMVAPMLQMPALAESASGSSAPPTAKSNDGLGEAGTMEPSGTWVAYFVDKSTGEKVYFTDPSITSDFTIAADTWWDGQCVSGEGRYEVLKDYPRTKAHPRQVGTYARLYCGMVNDDGAEHAFGLRHIKDGHKDDFGDLASLQGSTWGHFMHWAITHVIGSPDNRRNQSATRFCYEKEFTFKSVNGRTFDQWIAVILGETGVRIMTAFPKTIGDPGTPYCPRGAYF